MATDELCKLLKDKKDLNLQKFVLEFLTVFSDLSAILYSNLLRDAVFFLHTLYETRQDFKRAN